MSDRFDPDKDAINRDRHNLPLIFGDAVLADPDHLIVPTTERNASRPWG